MNCDKNNCSERGKMVYCKNYQLYHFTKCPYYSSPHITFSNERNKPLNENLLNKLRLDGL